jgi:hypothetical protein
MIDLGKTVLETDKQALFSILKKRFEKNMHRHPLIKWMDVQHVIERHLPKLWSLSEMERTGGEPDVVVLHQTANSIVFIDCADESPKGRRSLCYDEQALVERKENKPLNSAVKMAFEMGVEILDQEQYLALQTFGKFDAKTSSWLKTPEHIRNLGGAIFGDFRYDTVFVYHNSAQSYYAARGFRSILIF